MIIFIIAFLTANNLIHVLEENTCKTLKLNRIRVKFFDGVLFSMEPILQQVTHLHTTFIIYFVHHA